MQLVYNFVYNCVTLPFLWIPAAGLLGTDYGYWLNASCISCPIPVGTLDTWLDTIHIRMKAKRTARTSPDWRQAGARARLDPREAFGDGRAPRLGRRTDFSQLGPGVVVAVGPDAVLHGADAPGMSRLKFWLTNLNDVIQLLIFDIFYCSPIL